MRAGSAEAWLPLFLLVPGICVHAQTERAGPARTQAAAINRAAEVEAASGALERDDGAPEGGDRDVPHSGTAASFLEALPSSGTPGLERPASGADEDAASETGSAQGSAEGAAAKLLPPRSGRVRSGPSMGPDARSSPAQPSGAVWSVWSGLWPLVMVLGLLAGGAYFLRRWLPVRSSGETRGMRVVGRAMLSPRHQAVLLQVGNRLVLVGMSGDRLTTLSEMTDAEEVAELLAQSPLSASPEGRLFEHLFSREQRGFTELESRDGSTQTANDVRRNTGALSDLLRRLRSYSSF